MNGILPRVADLELAVGAEAKLGTDHQSPSARALFIEFDDT